MPDNELKIFVSTQFSDYKMFILEESVQWKREREGGRKERKKERWKKEGGEEGRKEKKNLKRERRKGNVERSKRRITWVCA